MKFLDPLRRLFRLASGRSTVEADVDAELALHIELGIEELIAAGWTRESARAEAFRRFGDRTRIAQACRSHDRREERRMQLAGRIAEIGANLRHAVRAERRSPGWFLAIVATLALGIGATTAVFTVVKSVLLDPLPYPESDRIVYLWQAGADQPDRTNPVSLPNYFDWRRETRSFSSMAATSWNLYTLTGDAEPEQLRGLQIEGDLFAVLSVSPMLGRPIQRADARDRVIVLGYELWTSRFAADSSIIGRTIRLSDQPFTVVGVMPSGFSFPSRGYSLWTSYQSIYAEGLDRFDRGRQFQNVVARLKPGVSVGAARAEMAAVMRRLVSRYPDANVGQTAVTVSLRDQLVGDVRPSVLLLFGAVTFVLLIAAANVANLLVVRALGRTQEMAVRGALGMGQGRLLGLFATEAIVQVGVSTVASVGLAQGLLLLLVRFRPRNVPGLEGLALDGKVLAFAVSVGLLVGLSLAVLPALMMGRSNLAQCLREGGRGATGGRRVSRLHESLVVVQVALSLMLLVGAGLLTKSFARLVEVQIGFGPAQVTSIQLGLPEARYAGPEIKVAAYDRLLAAVRAVPGVRAASLCGCWPPIDAFIFGWFTLEGRPDPGPSATPMASLVRIQGDYFSVLGVPIVRGRAFTDRETAAEPGLAIISQTLAHRYFGAEDPIGKRLKMGQFGTDNPWLTVVGVAADVKYTGLAADVAPAIYFSARQDPSGGLVLTVASSLETGALVLGIKAAVRQVDADLPLGIPYPIREVVDAELARPRFMVLLVSGFGAIALVLTVVGLWGVIAYTVTRRTQEVSVRMALGAAPRQLLWLVLGRGLRLALAGVAIGAGGALALSTGLDRFLYRTTARDPLTYVATVLGFVAIALMASYLPARRALRVDPMRALRE